MTEKIVITGGPCAGKSTALPIVAQSLRECGLNVLTVRETATDLMQNGITPSGMNSPRDFQMLNTEYMLSKLRMYERAAQNMPHRDTVILCDRGLCDCSVYSEHEDYAWLLNRLGLTPVTARDMYGAVFYLESAAKCAPFAYTTADSVRTETVEEAARLDDAVLRAWVGHPHMRIIRGGDDFMQKIDALTQSIKFYLGIPKPLEIERKFLIRYPDMDEISKRYVCRTVDIKQIYIKMPTGEKARIRKRGEGNDSIYIKTVKHKISDAVREEHEQLISREEYERLTCFADPERRPIIKKRTCIIANGKYFELDVFPFWSDRALLEIELESENESFILPETVKCVREVTGDRRYTNSALAKQVPNEEI